MKKLLAALLVALMLTGMALSVVADPIDVGGDFTASSFTSRGPAVFKGKGNPQGIPFQIPEVVTLCSPIDVGGD